MALNQPQVVHISSNAAQWSEDAWDFSNLMIIPIESPVACKVLSAEVSYDWKNFGRNAYQIKLIEHESSNTVTVSFNLNKYYQTLDKVASEIQTQIVADLGAGYLCSFDYDLMRLKITPASGKTISFQAVANDCYYKLGFYDWNNGGVYSNSSPYIAEAMADIQRTRCVYITADYASNTQTLVTKTFSTVAKIPVLNVGYGETLSYRAIVDQPYLSIQREALAEIHITVLDDHGFLLETNTVNLELAFSY